MSIFSFIRDWQDAPDRSRVRLALDLSPAVADRLDELVLKTDSRSKAEVIRNALRVYEYMVDEAIEGAAFYIKEEGDKEPHRFTMFRADGDDEDKADN